MVSQLYQRYNSLAQEKSETDLRLRHALALLSELQTAWMDLPPKVDESIRKILASHGHGAKPAIKDGGSSKSTPNFTWRWLSIRIEDVFGCTAGRSTEAADGQIKHPPPVALEDAREYTGHVSAGSAEDAGGPPRRIEALAMQPLGAEPIHVSLEPSGGPMASSSTMEVSDLLYEAPGVAGLIAEIDVLYRALQKDMERAFEDLNQRVEDIKSEAKFHQQRLEDHFHRSLAAANAELELCKAQLAQLSDPTVPRFSLANEDSQLDLCDGEWVWCRRAAELRAQAGRAHVSWLEDTLAQRFQVAELQLKSREREFQQDLSALWGRKAMLTSRIRGRMTVGLGDGAAGGRATGNEEFDQLRRALGDIEASVLAPLKELATMNVRHEVDHVRRLKGTISEAQKQCKAATLHLGSLAKQSKVELQARVSSANAALVAHDRLVRQHYITKAFAAWLLHLARERQLAAEQELAAYHSREADRDSQWRPADEAAEPSPTAQARGRRRSDSWLDRQPRCGDPSIVAAAIARARERGERRSLLATVFGCWANWRGRLERLKEELQAKDDKLAEFTVRLQSTEAAVGFKARRCPRQLLVAILRCWSAQRLRKLARSTGDQVASEEAQVRADSQLADLRSHLQQLLSSSEPPPRVPDEED